MGGYITRTCLRDDDQFTYHVYLFQAGIDIATAFNMCGRDRSAKCGSERIRIPLRKPWHQDNFCEIIHDYAFYS